MVKQNSSEKTKPINRRMFLAITIIVIANLFLGGVVSAKIMEISDKDVDKIKLVLDLTKLLSNLAVSDDKLKTVLNTVLKGGEISTDVTYGLLVLSSLNEAELVDMVVSQRYKDEARDYFNQTLDERTNLISYWKGIGFDLPKILSGNVTSPMAALTLNSFAITNKTILIFSEFDVLKKEKLYDGLWYYFDLRKNGNEPHSTAWKEAKEVMGWAALDGWSFSYKKSSDSNLTQLESQFSSLWDTWGQYITPFGLSKEVKDQAKAGLSDVVVSAISNFTEKLPQPSVVGQAIGAINSILQNTWNAASSVFASIKSIFVKDAPLQAGLAINLLNEPTEAEPTTQNGLKEAEGVNLDKIQEELDDISERADILNQEFSQANETELELEPAVDEKSEEPQEQPNDIETTEQDEQKIADDKEEPAEPEPENELEQTEQPVPVVLVKQSQTKICEKLSGDNPARDRVVLNEIAWMGTLDSANNEWIELKNISGGPVNLAGWQILDKDRQIKIIFGDGVSPIFITINGFYLLERTDDGSVPHIAADLVYGGALNNTNESLFLFDENCELQDEATASPNWPAGDSSEKKAMERGADLTWHTYTGILQNGILGTPKAENSPAPIAGTGGGGAVVSAGGGSSSQSAPPEEESQSPAEPDSALKILITEVQIGSATSANDDFIELYNPSTSSADIAGFQLKKKSSTGGEYSIRLLPDGSLIPALGYFLWLNSDYAASSQISADATSTQTLSKDNSIAILDKDKNIIDALSWGSSTDPFVETSSFAENPAEGESLGRKWLTGTETYQDTNNNEEDFELQAPTPKTQNQSPVPEGPAGPEESSEETIVLSVAINEIAWMGTKASAQDEWIELFNNTDEDINIAGWSLTSGDGSPDIVFPTSTGPIPARGFYLLERTGDETTISNVAADWFGSFGSGGLKNGGEELELRDGQGNLIDKVGCQKDEEENECRGWFAGENSIKQTMERINSELPGSDPGNWASNNPITRNGRDEEMGLINGTPKAENSVAKAFTELEYLDFRELDSLTLTTLSGPYIVRGHIIVPLEKTLLVEPGVVVKFKTDSGIYIEGTFLAGQSEGEPVVFTSIYDKDYAIEIIPEHDRDPLPGDWDWIYIKDSFGSKIENAVFRYGGRYHVSSTYSFPPFTRGMLQVEGGEAILKDLRLEKSFSIGIWLLNSSSTVDSVELLDIGAEGYSGSAGIFAEGREEKSVIKNSVFRNSKFGLFIARGSNPIVQENIFENNETPIIIDDLIGPAVLAAFSGNTIQNNGLDGIVLSNIAFPYGVSEVEWQKAGVPFIVKSIIDVPEGLALTIKPGVVIKMIGGGRIYVRGTLSAQGSPEEPIVFTAFTDDEYGGDTNGNGPSEGWPGYWNFMYFYPSSEGSLLQSVVVRYGGLVSSFGSDAPNFGAVLVDEAAIRVSDSIIENNLIYGIKLKSSDSTIENTIFRNPPIEAQDASDEIKHPSSLNLFNSVPDLTGSLFENSYYGIYVSAGDCPDLSEVSFDSNTYDIWPEECGQ